MTSHQLEAALVRRLRNNEVRLPPYPAVVARLKRLATAPNVDLTQLATVLSSDPALAGMVIANASQVEGPVTTLGAALARLDAKELTGIVLAADLGRAAVLGGPLSPLRRDAWRCALLSARIAQELAPARGISPDEAHLAGLLHNFGAMVVIATLEDIAAEQPLPPLPQTAWSALVAKLQVEFGLLTAIRWGLPRSLIEVIEHHGDPSTPLECLIDLVDEVIATLDRVPAAGVTALLGIDELTPVECARIAIVIPQVVKQMASFAPLSTRHVPVIIPPIDGEDTWPIDLGIQIRQGTYRACALSPSAIMFTGPAPLEVNWLTEVVVQCEPRPITLLANVKRCEQLRSGQFSITVCPFALAGPVKAAWLALVEHTRRLGDVSIVRTRDDLPRLSL